MMIDPGIVGSPTDVATLLVVLWGVYRLEDDLGTVGAALVALARPRDDVDDERLQAELEVEDRDVNPLVEEVVDR